MNGSPTATPYTIEIETSGAFDKAKTHAKVFVKLTNDDGDTTDFTMICDNFKNAAIVTFPLNVKDIGIPAILHFKLEHHRKNNPDEWYCNKVKVTYNSETFMFPVYDWVFHEIEVAQGKAVAPHQIKSDVIKKLRERELAVAKKVYKWRFKSQEGQSNGMPNHLVAGSKVDDLPLIFGLLTDKRSERRRRDQIKYLVATIKEKLEGIFTKIRDFDDYHDFYNNLLDGDETIETEKEKYKDCLTDSYLGNQVLNGTNPLDIKLCTSIPSYFNIEDDDVKYFFDDGEDTIHDALENKKLFILDYSDAFDGLPRNVTESGDQLNVQSAVGLFYMRNAGELMPIAIQIVPNDRDYFFTPSCDENSWLLAKFHLKTAHFCNHEWDVHLLRTHFVMEPICISLFRCLPKAHPIYKLMRPHLIGVVWINTFGREKLVGPSSKFNKVVAVSGAEGAQKAFTKFDYSDLIIPKLLKKQGTDDSTILPPYYYRDDSLNHWTIIHEYVTDVLQFTYESDENVSADYELKAMMEDLCYNGYAWGEGDSPKGFPTSFEGISQLAEFCTAVIFTCTIQHSAVNFNQFDTYKFVPNAPLGLRKEPLKNTQRATMQYILDSLPDSKTAALAPILGAALSRYMDDEVYLGEFPLELFGDKAIRGMQAKFRQDLEIIEIDIEQRNRTAPFPYTLLLPKTITETIGI